MKSPGALTCLVTAGVLTAVPAYAYVDPGAGGLLIQLLTGGVAGALVLVRLYWLQLKSWLARGRVKDGRR